MRRLLLLVAASLLPFAAPARAAGTFSHAALTQVLSRYVNAAGKVDYKGILADRATFDGYLAAVAADSPTSTPALFPTRNDRLAYYLNAYNALAVKGVLDRPGLRSVDAVKVAFFGLTRYELGHEKLTLYGLENTIIRGQFQDPRVHFALNCQSAGCPRLPQVAFDPARLDAELDSAAREFCTDPHRVSVDAEGVAHLSQIFQWYAEDFASAGGAVAFVNAHGGHLPVDAKVTFTPYDWTLSAQPGRGP